MGHALAQNLGDVFLLHRTADGVGNPVGAASVALS